MKKTISLLLAVLLAFSCLVITANAVEANGVYFNGKAITENYKTVICKSGSDVTTSYMSYIVYADKKQVEIIMCNTALGENADGSVNGDYNYEGTDFISPLYINYPGYAVILTLLGKNRITSGVTLEKGSTGIYCNAKSLSVRNTDKNQSTLDILGCNAVYDTAGIYCTGSMSLSTNNSKYAHLILNITVNTSAKGALTAVYAADGLTVKKNTQLKTKVAGVGGKYTAAVYTQGSVTVEESGLLWAIGDYKGNTGKNYGIYQKTTDGTLSFAGEVIIRGSTKAVNCDTSSSNYSKVMKAATAAYTSGKVFYVPCLNPAQGRTTLTDDDITDLFNQYSLYFFPGEVYLSLGGVFVHDQSKGNVYGDGTVKYDSENRVLTLTNANIYPTEDTAVLSFDWKYDKDRAYTPAHRLTSRSGIYVLDESTEKITFALNGSNLVHGGDNFYYGVRYDGGNIDMTGDGSLSVSIRNEGEPRIGNSNFSGSPFNAVGVAARSLTITDSVSLNVEIYTANGAIGIQSGGMDLFDDAKIEVIVQPLEGFDQNEYYLYGIDFSQTSENLGLTMKGNSSIRVETGNIAGMGKTGSCTESKGINAPNWIYLCENAFVYTRAGTAYFSVGFVLDNDYYYKGGSWIPTSSYIKDNARVYAYSNGGGHCSVGMKIFCSNEYVLNAKTGKVKLYMASDSKTGMYPILACGSGIATDGYTSALLLDTDSILDASDIKDLNKENTAYVTYCTQSNGIGSVKEKLDETLSSSINSRSDVRDFNTNNKYGARYDSVEKKYINGYRFVQIWAGGKTVEIRLYERVGSTEIWKTLNVLSGGTVKTLPTPYRAGYKFKCWATQTYSGFQEYNSSWTVEPSSGYLNLYAMWEKYITLTCKAGKDAAGSDAYMKIVDEGATVKLSDFDIKKPTMQYGKFIGWYYYNSENKKTMVTDGTQFGTSTTLFAEFERTHYVIQLDANGGDVLTSLLVVEAGKKYVSSIPTPTKTGYIFDGWYLGGTRVSENAVADDDITLTARWHKHAVSKTVNAVKANCVTDGNNKYYICSCGLCFTDTACQNVTTPEEQIIPKTGVHSWDSGTVTVPAAVGKEGVKTFECFYCDATKTEKIPALTEEPTDPVTPPVDPTDPTDPVTPPVGPTDPTDPVTPPVTFMKGDVDNDGNVTVSDARLALRAAINLTGDKDISGNALDFTNKDSREYKAADVDGAEGVKVGDARLILRVAIKLDKF